MIEKETINKLRERYSHLHPMLFHLSVERANDAGELFEILESVPAESPVLWDENKRRWVVTDDLTQARLFEMPK